MVSNENLTFSDHGEGHAQLDNYQLIAFHWDGVKGPLIITVWILLGILAKMIFHMGPVRKYTRIFPDSSLLLILGLIIGCIVHYGEADTNYYVLSPELFFPFLLPPIVLEAGYFMPNRLLFHNIGAVSCFAVLGTIFNTACIGLSLWGLQYATPYIGDEALPLIQILLFAALICAVDPVAVLAVFDEVHVNDNLNISVFGESLFNDAVTVVLYHMFSSFIEITSTKGYLSASDLVLGPLSFFVVAIGGALIGLIFAFVASFLTRFTNHVRLLEPLLVLGIGYGSYLVAEMIRLSSILAIVCYGQFVRQFVSLNFSKESKNTLNSMIKILANSSETVIFIFIGTSAWSDTHVWSIPFILYTLLFCLLYRAIGVFSQCYFLNKTRIPEQRYAFRDQMIMAYGGLRGAIAYGLAASINVFENGDIKNMYLTTTIVVVIFTVFIQGSTIKPLVERLGVERKEEVEPTIMQVEFEEVQDSIKACLTSIVGHKGHSYMLHSFDQFNNRYFYPIMLREEARKSQHTEERKQSIKDLYNMMHSLVTHHSFPKIPSIHSIHPLDMMKNGSKGHLPRSKKSVVNMVTQVYEEKKHKKKQLWHRNESMFAHNAWDDDHEEHKMAVKKQRLQMLHANFLTHKLSSNHLLDHPSKADLQEHPSQASIQDRSETQLNGKVTGTNTPSSSASKSRSVSFHPDFYVDEDDDLESVVVIGNETPLQKNMNVESEKVIHKHNIRDISKGSGEIDELTEPQTDKEEFPASEQLILPSEKQDNVETGNPQYLQVNELSDHNEDTVAPEDKENDTSNVKKDITDANQDKEGTDDKQDMVTDDKRDMVTNDKREKGLSDDKQEEVSNDKRSADDVCSEENEMIDKELIDSDQSRPAKNELTSAEGGDSSHIDGNDKITHNTNIDELEEGKTCIQGYSFC